MKIVDIFDDRRLLSFHYEGEKLNEFDRLMELWTSVEQLRKYGKANGIDKREDLNNFIERVNENAEKIEDWLDEIEYETGNLSEFFEPLDFKETEKMLRQLSLTKQKGKRYILRFYAIRIDEYTFIITGGAIKQSHFMIDHKETEKELEKLEEAYKYLKKNDVFDTDSLNEFRDEQSE